MFEVGQVVVHKDHGLCEIKGTEFISYVSKDYFVLYPENNKNTKILVPCDMIESICRHVISKEECLSIIDQIKDMDKEYIVDNKKRKEEYVKMLQSGNLFEIVHLIKMLRNLFEDKKASNKMIGTIDTSIYNDAVNKLYSEIRYVLGLNSFEEVETFIESRIA